MVRSGVALILLGVLSAQAAPSPGALSLAMCLFQDQPISCAKDVAASMLDAWQGRLDDEMRSWGEEADAEVLKSGRQLSALPETPSQTGQKLMMAINELANILQKSLHRSQARKKEGGGGIDSITISTGGGDDKKKKDKKKKKKKQPALHIHHDEQEPAKEEDKGVLVEPAAFHGGQTMVQGLWVDEELAGPAKTRIKREEDDTDLREDGRGKKKKKKKAILKLLLLGAVLKAKIGLLLQLFSAHLQVKFFAIALAGLALNIARFWLDVKKGHQPQKVIYYEHAQHQHHYEHEDDHGWGGYWSRSIDETPKIKRQEEVVHPSWEEPSQADSMAYGGWTGRNSQRSINRRK